MRRLYETLRHWSVTDRFFFAVMTVVVIGSVIGMAVGYHLAGLL